jgi:glycosyltransferase involved in cell wall biosynthesis
LEPLVSVVIPTYKRPQLVKRAVRSALAQTLQNIEVIVVIDGPDPVAEATLNEIEDSRLRTITLPVNQGLCVVRNTGVAAAKAQWIAQLDDDDEWFPQKLEKQLAAATSSHYRLPIVTCCLEALTPEGEFIYPRRLPNPSEPLSEYLFVRNTLFQGEGLIQASTIFTSKELLQRVPCGNPDRPGSSTHEDWEWVLKATSLEGVGVEFVDEPLSTWDLRTNASSMSRKPQWQASLEWIRGNRDLVSPRAYSSFVLAEVSAYAFVCQAWYAFFYLLVEALRFGRPQPKDILLHCAIWLVPPQVRKILRQWLTGKPKSEPVEESISVNT